MGRFVPDVLGPGLGVLFCGINPSLYSAAVGHHFARPGNRFWKALHQGGLTPRLLAPDEEDELLALGLGITNLVERATAGAADLGAAELREGGARLAAKAAAVRPRMVAVVDCAKPCSANVAIKSVNRNCGIFRLITCLL